MEISGDHGPERIGTRDNHNQVQGGPTSKAQRYFFISRDTCSNRFAERFVCFLWGERGVHA